jgi:hypothetical protein
LQSSASYAGKNYECPVIIYIGTHLCMKFKTYVYLYKSMFVWGNSRAKLPSSEMDRKRKEKNSTYKLVI